MMTTTPDPSRACEAQDCPRPYGHKGRHGGQARADAGDTVDELAAILSGFRSVGHDAAYLKQVLLRYIANDDLIGTGQWWGFHRGDPMHARIVATITRERARRAKDPPCPTAPPPPPSVDECRGDGGADFSDALPTGPSAATTRTESTSPVTASSSSSTESAASADDASGDGGSTDAKTTRCECIEPCAYMHEVGTKLVVLATMLGPDQIVIERGWAAAISCDRCHGTGRRAATADASGASDEGLGRIAFEASMSHDGFETRWEDEGARNGHPYWFAIARAVAARVRAGILDDYNAGIAVYVARAEKAERERDNARDALAGALAEIDGAIRGLGEEPGKFSLPNAVERASAVRQRMEADNHRLIRRVNREARRKREARRALEPFVMFGEHVTETESVSTDDGVMTISAAHFDAARKALGKDGGK